MQNFKEFVTSDQQVQKLEKIQSLLPKAYALYLSLIKDTQIPIKEALDWYAASKPELNVEYFIKNIIDHPDLVEFIKQNYNTEVKRTIREPLYSFGAEGIVFFFDNDICIKFQKYPRKDDPQFNVACELAGELELVPVLDCFEILLGDINIGQKYENIIVPAIVMRTIKEVQESLERDIVDAYDAVSTYVNSLLTMYRRQMRDGQEISHADVGTRLMPDNMVSGAKEAMSKRFVTASFKMKHLTENGEKAVRDIATILHRVYGQTAWLFGADISGGRNLGKDSTGQVMPFDLGIGLRTRELPKPRKKQVRLN